jgi:hypothetical protein
MSSLKQLIFNTLVKCATPAPGTVPDSFETAEEARDSFIASVMAELFPEHGSSESAVVEVPVVEAAPVASPAKKLTKEEKEAAKAAKEAEKAAAAKAKEDAKAAKEAEKAAKAEAKAAKAASPKKSPEEKAAEKAAKDAEKAAAKEAEKAAKEAAKLAEKAAKEAEKAAAKAAKEAAKPAKVKSPKEAAKVVLPASPKPEVNLAKIDPTWRKALKEADKDHAKELEPELLKHLNALSNAGFHSRTAREHVAEFLASRAPVAEPSAPVDLEVVEFQGKEFYVNRETKRVYEGVTNAEGELTITRPVGYVGMADFKDMELEDE